MNLELHHLERITMKATTVRFPTTPPKEIKRELATLRDHYDVIVKNVGKFVLIRGNSVVAYFDSYRAAIEAGYKRFGLGSFLVRHIKKRNPPIRAVRWSLTKLANNE